MNTRHVRRDRTAFFFPLHINFSLSAPLLPRPLNYLSPFPTTTPTGEIK